MKTGKTKNTKGMLKKRLFAVCLSTMLVASSVTSYSAAPPTGVDTTSYNALTTIIFWIAGIAVAAAGGIPSIIKIVQGQADEDPRGRNAGIAGAVITGACVGALAAIKTILF